MATLPHSEILPSPITYNPASDPSLEAETLRTPPPMPDTDTTLASFSGSANDEDGSDSTDDVDDIVPQHHESHNASHAPQEDLFSGLATAIETDIMLSNLLRETHHAISNGESDSHISQQVTTFLTQAAPQHDNLMETASDLIAPGISSITDLTKQIMDLGHEHAMRDSDPPRTLTQHLRELIAEGDDPGTLIQAMEQWSNPDRDSQTSETIRLTMAEEWSRKLAMEQLPPGTIHASLTLNVPDTEIPGHSHTAVAQRVHREVSGADAQPPAHSLSDARPQIASTPNVDTPVLHDTPRR